MAGDSVVGGRPIRDLVEDRRWPVDGVIGGHLRVLAGAALVGWVVGAVGGGIVGRLLMRLLVLTSDARVDGAITDDEAVVNQFTFSGSAGLLFFLALAGIGLAWLYVGARWSMPTSLRARALIWAVLTWSVTGAGVFEPDGFDFTQLSPTWLAVLSFSALFLAMGALIAVGVERAIERWPSRPLALLPFVLAGPFLPIAVPGGIVAAFGADVNERFRAVRIFGALVMVALFLWLGPATFANVLRILV